MNAKVAKVTAIVAFTCVFASDVQSITLYTPSGSARVFLCREDGNVEFDRNRGYICTYAVNGRPQRQAPITFETAVLEAAAPVTRPLTQRIDILEGELKQKNDQIGALTRQLELLAAQVNQLKKSQ